MIVETPEELAKLKRIGRIVALAIQAMRAAVGPGVTTAQLDAIGADVLRRHGARSAPQLAYNFPGATCISVNDEAAHGIPGGRVLQPGDLVNLDVSAELDGIFADAGWTAAVPPLDSVRHNLLLCTQRALKNAIAAARTGEPLNGIGRAIENEANSCGFHTLHDLGGHGVGRAIHEEPHNIACYTNPLDKRVLQEGAVIAIEPFLTTGAENVYTAPDKWTLRTVDASLSAQFEHTVVVARGKPVIITALG